MINDKFQLSNLKVFSQHFTMDCVFLALTESLGLPAQRCTEVVKIENLLFKRKEKERATSSAKEIAEIA